MEKFDKFNRAFLDANATARRNMIKRHPVILVLGGDDCIFMRQSSRVETLVEKLDLTVYHVIKTVCHYISSLAAGLIANPTRIVSSLRSSPLRRSVLDPIPDGKILPDQESVTALVALIEKHKSLFQFEGNKYWCRLCALLEPERQVADKGVISLAMKHCAVLYAGELHLVVQGLREKVDPVDWNRILVIVTGPPSPRPGHSAMQYFARLTGQSEASTIPFYLPDPKEAVEKQGRRLFYVENVTVSSVADVDKVCDIVAQQLLERAHFDAIVDMSTDILAVDTQAHLHAVCKK